MRENQVTRFYYFLQQFSSFTSFNLFDILSCAVLIVLSYKKRKTEIGSFLGDLHTFLCVIFLMKFPTCFTKTAVTFHDYSCFEFGLKVEKDKFFLVQTQKTESKKINWALRYLVSKLAFRSRRIVRHLRARDWMVVACVTSLRNDVISGQLNRAEVSKIFWRQTLNASKKCIFE